MSETERQHQADLTVLFLSERYATALPVVCFSPTLIERDVEGLCYNSSVAEYPDVLLLDPRADDWFGNLLHEYAHVVEDKYGLPVEEPPALLPEIRSLFGLD